MVNKIMKKKCVVCGTDFEDYAQNKDVCLSCRNKGKKTAGAI